MAAKPPTKEEICESLKRVREEVAKVQTDALKGGKLRRLTRASATLYFLDELADELGCPYP